jgi:hypothetical protein
MGSASPRAPRKRDESLPTFAPADFDGVRFKRLETLKFYVKISFTPTPIFVAFLQLLQQK